MRSIKLERPIQGDQSIKNRKIRREKDGRERGIRTPGGVTLNGFQDRRFRPLSHLPFVMMEATLGFEPRNQGFAGPCLTTWLCRHGARGRT